MGPGNIAVLRVFSPEIGVVLRDMTRLETQFASCFSSCDPLVRGDVGEVDTELPLSSFLRRNTVFRRSTASFILSWQEALPFVTLDNPFPPVTL
ncbi:hypothetical protein Mapa_007060 [Marchantia paleacea]|nr:hypothetical protein Mapa_007060 [Marchantia paleacea]